MNHKVRVSIFIVLFLMVATVSSSLAQAPPPMLPGSPEQAPLNGGLLLLAASGIAYAWKKLASTKKDV